MKDLDTLMEKYVEKYSNPPYFTIPSSNYDEYKECQKLVKTQLKLQFKRVIDFISENNLYETDEGYIARDKNGKLFLYNSEPHKDTVYYNEWDAYLYKPDSKMFSSITWDSEPLKVQLIFKPI